MVDRTRQAISDFLDEHHAQQVAFLQDIVRRPSDNPPGDCAGHAEFVAERLAQIGLDVERHVVDPSQARAAGMVSVTNLIVRHRFGVGPTIALNAHGDVVPPGEGWTREPYGGAIEADTIYGRGAAVSKSDFATYTFALLALIAAKPAIGGTVELHFTYDEESGGAAGPKWLLENKLSRPDMVVSAGFSYGVVTAHNGCLHLAVEVRGRQAHAAMPAHGVDALEAANGILSALYDHRRRLGRHRSKIPGIGAPSLVVGLIDGGINTNVVPDRVTFRLDRRMIPEEDPVAAEAELRALIAEAAGAYPDTRHDVRRIMLAEPLVPAPASDGLAQAFVAAASLVLGEKIGTHGVPLYTDARHYAAAGIPTILYGAGPRSILEANAHGADEHLRLDDLRRASEVVALALAELLRT